MATETEIKLQLPDPDRLRTRLGAPAAARRGYVLEVNRILDTAERRLLDSGCGLRLREARSLEGPPEQRAELTFKGPRVAGPVKIREELEVVVSDAATLRALFERLGFHEVLVYEKRRESWQYGACVVTIDELPLLGFFAEIEAPSAAAIMPVRAELQLEACPLVAETYVELAATHGQIDSAGRRRLLFG